MTTHLSQQSRLLAGAVALAVAIVAALALAQLRDAGGGPPAQPLNAPAAVAPAGGGVTLHQSRSTSRVTVDGKTATGESVTAVGKPGTSAKGKAADNGKTGSAKGGNGGSASATGGSATAGSVKVQTVP